MRETTSKQARVKVHPMTIQLLVDATWEFAHRELWNNQPFTNEEIACSKGCIEEYYREIDPEKFYHKASQKFNEFCQRILLAQRYVNRFAYRYIPHPCVWLNRHNPKGFAGTKGWYEANQQKHRYNPQEADTLIKALVDHYMSHPLNQAL